MLRIYFGFDFFGGFEDAVVGDGDEALANLTYELELFLVYCSGCLVVVV